MTKRETRETNVTKLIGGKPFKTFEIDVGDAVFCDWCDTEWTNRPESGGFMFGRKATCPDCASRMEASATEHNESHHIRERCPADKSFADWIRQDIR